MTDIIIPVGNYGIDLHLCATGKLLHDKWEDEFYTDATSHRTYRAMQAYFIHKNGTATKPACPGCGYQKAVEP